MQWQHHRQTNTSFWQLPTTIYTLSYSLKLPTTFYTLGYSLKLISENAKRVLTDHCISSFCSDIKIFCMTDTLSVHCCSDIISDKVLTTSENYLNSGLLFKSNFWKCEKVLTEHCISSVCSDSKIFCMTDTLSVNCWSDNIFDKHIHRFDNFRQQFKLWIIL